MSPHETNGSQNAYIIAGHVCPPPKLALPGGKTRMAMAMLMGIAGHAAMSVTIQGRACFHWSWRSQSKRHATIPMAKRKMYGAK